MIVLEHQHPRAGRQRQRLGGGRNAVADRRYQRHVAWIGVDQAGRSRARTLELAGCEAGIQEPRPALAGGAIAAGLLHGERNRAPRRGVEIANLARDIEQRALRWQHWRPFGAPSRSGRSIAPTRGAIAGVEPRPQEGLD